MRARTGERFRVVFFSGLALLGCTRAFAAPMACTPGACDDNNICTVNTCDPVQGCIYTPVNCDDGTVCTVDTCSPTGGPGVATIFTGHDISQLEREYQKIGTFIQTWGALPKATGVAIDANGIVYVVDPAQGNNTIERRGPGNTNLGTITATVNNQWIEDMGNFAGGFILAGTYEGDVHRINTTTGASTLQFSTGQLFVGVTSDGTNIWTTGGYTNTLVKRRDLVGNVLSSFNTGQTNLSIGLDPDDGTLWIGHFNSQVSHWSQAGAPLGGFGTGAGGQLVDGLELGRLPLAPGCQHNALSCSDNDPCTINACDPMTGCYYTPNLCDDGDPCTDDACSPQLGCGHTNNTAPCEDSNLCTTGDTCSAGQCLPGPAVVCNDNNVCTTDSCDPRFGCVYTNTNGYCDDGDACTVEDVCVNGTCEPGFPVSCDDNNVCTTDSCNPPGGCIHVTNSNTCDDNNLCTNGDTCINGVCQGAPVPCSTDQCHLGGTCDPATGMCSNPPAPNGTACNDGNPCTAGDKCIDGACVGSSTIAIPTETHNLSFAADKITLSWSANPEATSYDAVRGDVGSLPVGSSSTGTEVCFHDLPAPGTSDTATPALRAAFWYVSRAVNPCGYGPWGAQSNGTARVTTTCP